MPILSVEGMLDCASQTISSVAQDPVLGTPYRGYGNSASAYSQNFITQSDGWLDFETGPNNAGSTTVSKYLAIGRFLSDYTTITSSTYLYGGVRIKSKYGTTSATYGLVGFYDTRVVPNAAGNVQAILTAADVQGGFAAGQEYYFEWAVDMVNQKFLRRLDGVRLPDIAFAAGFNAAFLAQGMGICYGYTANINTAQRILWGYSIKDIYVGEKVAGETADWLGPRSVAPIAISEVTAPWTPTSGTILEAWNTPVTDAVSFTAPNAATDAGGTEAAIKLQAPNIAGKIDAICINSIARRKAASLGGLGLTVEHSNGNLGKPDVPLTTSFQQLQLGTFPTAPGGGGWTKSLIAGVTVKVKPKN